jgi:hypothetical protein
MQDRVFQPVSGPLYEERARRLVGKGPLRAQIRACTSVCREREPLVEWSRKSAQAANTNDVMIRFERKNGGERSTAGYF